MGLRRARAQELGLVDFLSDTDQRYLRHANWAGVDPSWHDPRKFGRALLLQGLAYAIVGSNIRGIEAMNRINHVVLIILDSVGIGSLPDAPAYGDVGSNTLGNVARALGGLRLPHLARLGLGHLTTVAGVRADPLPAGAYGRMAEASAGKDTTIGHWEITGLISPHPLPTYPDGFPPEVISEFERRIGRKILGNKPASGTVIIEELGPEHLRTGSPIVYTSADSVFQVAAHEEIIPVSELYRICRIAREILTGPHNVGRVIARPFLGEAREFRSNRPTSRFFRAPAWQDHLDSIVEAGQMVWAVGKIEDIMAGHGISLAVHTHDNEMASTKPYD